MMDYADIGKRYTRMRAVTMGLNHKLTKLLSKQTLEEAARQLGMWSKGVIVFRDVDQTSVLMDAAIHDCREKGKTALERFREKYVPAAGSEEELALEAMGRAFYGVMQIESVVPGEGVHVHEIIGERRYFLADKGFSRSASRGMVVATRGISV